MYATQEWLIIGLAIVWLGTPWTLVTLGWKMWGRTRTRGNPMEDLIDDPAFVIGQTLASISCCTLLVLFVPTALTLQITVANRVLGYGFTIAAVSALIGIVVLPFAVKRSKWFGFASCLLNVGFIFTFVVIESA
jgi:MFS family permease